MLGHADSFFRRVGMWVGFGLAIFQGFLVDILTLAIALPFFPEMDRDLGTFLGVAAVYPIVAFLTFDLNILNLAWAHRTERFPAVEGALDVAYWLRPTQWAAAVWCFGRFASGFGFAVAVEFYASSHLPLNFERWTNTASTLSILALVFALTYASNLYLVIGAGAFVRSRESLERIWSARLLLDGLVTVVAGALLLSKR